MKLRLPRLREGVAYIGTSLYLPRSHFAEAPIRAALTFGVDTLDEPRVVLREHPLHLEVPRNFQTVTMLQKMGVEEIVDLRPTAFTKSSLRPKPGFQFLEHQLPIWAELEKAHRESRDGVLRVGTGQGKTVLGLRYACLVGGPVLVMSAQEAHLKSWENEIEERFLLDGPVGWVMGKKMDYRREVVFSTVQTVVKRRDSGELPYDFHTRFALIIEDEAHHLGAECFSRSTDVDMGRRLGLTATLKRIDRCEGIVLFHMGPVIYDDPEERKLVPTIHLHATEATVADDDPEILDVNGQSNISKMRSWIGRQDARNRQVCDVVQMRLKQGHKVYVASHSKDQVYALAEILWGERDVNVGVITGDEKDADRRMAQLNGENVVVVTLGVGKENYNRPALSALVVASPMAVDDYAPTEFVQIVGRVLRPLPGKLAPTVDLFVDRGVSASFGLLQTVLRWCRKNNWKIEDDEWDKNRKSKTQRAFSVSASGRGSSTTSARSTGRK